MADEVPGSLSVKQTGSAKNIWYLSLDELLYGGGTVLRLLFAAKTKLQGWCAARLTPRLHYLLGEADIFLAKANPEISWDIDLLYQFPATMGPAGSSGMLKKLCSYLQKQKPCCTDLGLVYVSQMELVTMEFFLQADGHVVWQMRLCGRCL